MGWKARVSRAKSYADGFGQTCLATANISRARSRMHPSSHIAPAG